MNQTDSLSFNHEVFECSDFFKNEFHDPQINEEGYGAGENDWDWEMERELNGDIALIPMSSNVNMDYLSNSPPVREDFHKIMSDWQQQFMSCEVSDMELLTSDVSLPDELELDDIKGGIPIFDSSTWSLVDSINSLDKPETKLIRSVGKKIDKDAQCYVIESKSESITSPVKLEIDSHEDTKINCKLELEKDIENDYIDVDTISESGVPILQAGDLDSLLEQFEASETIKYVEPTSQPPSTEELFESTSLTANQVIESKSPKSDQVIESKSPKSDCKEEEEESEKNRQILKALPEELINRIKASSKRRIIPVIEPIPSKRRGVKKATSEVQNVLPVVQEKDKKVNSECVKLDHDYCTQPTTTPYPKYPKKDSGFESAEEEEQRNILRNQRTVKGADGKLMVSLLKINTIHNNITESNKKKRKLNLEEYKKRRKGLLRLNGNSQNNSPISSGCNSPSIVEDENVRLLKHQQKLMQMAAEVLKTPAKSATKVIMSPPRPVPLNPSLETLNLRLPPCIPPENVEVKVIVSIGINTDVSSFPAVLLSKEVELEEIRPILQNAVTKINPNSLITSVIENLQNKKKIQDIATVKTETVNLDVEHGEDKTFVYLDKCRPKAITKNVEVQTGWEIDDNIGFRRRRNSSSSSSDHRKSYKRRSSSNDSYCSSGSESSSCSFSSRSRSPSPRRIAPKKRVDLEKERIREVEERRIVYVGGINSSISKETLRKRFQVFGPISNISVHFREYGDNYGFVTFVHKGDAYKAVEHGNDDHTLPKYDLSFGGRRIFCRTHYSDLDNVQDDPTCCSSKTADSFDNLLREFQAQMRKRKSCT